MPVGEAWQEALRADPGLPLYHHDGLHPTQAGAYLTGLVIAHGLTGVAPDAVPARLTLASGHVFELPEGLALQLRRAAKETIKSR